MLLLTRLLSPAGALRTIRAPTQHELCHRPPAQHTVTAESSCVRNLTFQAAFDVNVALSGKVCAANDWIASVLTTASECYKRYTGRTKKGSTELGVQARVKIQRASG
eukprot:487813-Rhodomonas_salina.1